MRPFSSWNCSTLERSDVRPAVVAWGLAISLRKQYFPGKEGPYGINRGVGIVVGVHRLLRPTVSSISLIILLTPVPILGVLAHHWPEQLPWWVVLVKVLV